MISREQVADLIPGDVVHLVHADWAQGSFCQGPVDEYVDILGGQSLGALYLCGYQIRYPDGEPLEGPWTLQVLYRVPRPEPLFANHPRTVLCDGDVVRDGDGRTRYVAATPELGSHPLVFWAFDVEGNWHWTWTENPPRPLTLIFDAETEQVVAS